MCARQEMALQVHRDSGKIDIDDNNKNEGNFCAIHKYRAAGDGDLREIMEEPGERNKYSLSALQYKMK